MIGNHQGRGSGTLMWLAHQTWSVVASTIGLVLVAALVLDRQGRFSVGNRRSVFNAGEFPSWDE